MSSLSCEPTLGSCIFTRVDTDGGPHYNQTIAPWTDPTNQDAISSLVAITRDFTGGIFNARVGEDANNYGAPSGTEWALLPYNKTFEEARCKMRFCNWMECFALYDPTNMVGKKGIVHLIEEDLYYNIEFLKWTSDPYNQGYVLRKRRLEEEESAKNRRARSQAHGRRSKANEGKQQQQQQQRQQQDEYISVPPEDVPPDYDGLGGGFSYRRDENPIPLPQDLPPCPVCGAASASPRILTGRIDDEFVDVGVIGVTPADATITIKAVAQDQHPGCNSQKVEGTQQVQANARNLGGQTVQLRRTRAVGSLNPFGYTIYFDATTKGGTCAGSVYVCVPPEGFDDCDSWMGIDATSTEVCYN
jgi:hypothetical protein